jgi:hypothetical protein
MLLALDMWRAVGRSERLVRCLRQLTLLALLYGDLKSPMRLSSRICLPTSFRVAGGIGDRPGGAAACDGWPPSR